MKINLKKVASVLASAVMFGSTIGFAAAAWPEPFVKSGAGDAAIVVGTNVVATDMSAATDLGTSLNAKVTSTGTTTVTGDSIQLEKSSDKFNLVNTADSFYSTLDESELSKVLGEGVYTNDDNNEYDFEQSIKLGIKSLNLTYFQNDDFNDEKPVIGFNLINDEHILNYTLKFTPTAAAGGTSLANLETTDLTILGTSYYILDAVGNTANGIKLTLLDNANTDTVSETEPKTIVVGDKSYVISISFIDATNAILEVDGVKTNKLQAGDVYKVATDTYVAIKNVLYNAKEAGTSQVELSIGSGKIVLEDNVEVKMNDKFISDDTDMILTTIIENTSTDINSITLSWDLDDDFWIAPGTDLVLPGFKTIKLSMTGFTVPAEEVTTLKASSDEVLKVKTTIKDGELDLPILYNNDSSILGVGEKVKHNLVTRQEYLGANTTTAAAGSAINVTLVEGNNSYFVASWTDGADEAESYVFEIDSITNSSSGKVAVELKNLVTNTNDVKFSEVLDTDEYGRIKFTLAAADDVGAKKDAIISVEAASSGTVYLDRIYTKEGLTIGLPVLADEGYSVFEIDAGKNSSSWTMNFTEEDKDGNIGRGRSFTALNTINVDDGLEPSTMGGAMVSSMMYETESDSKKYVGYVPSDLATKVLWDKPSSNLKSLEVTYAGEESYGNVYISEADSTILGTNSVKVIKDSEVDSAKDKNLIVVGGSCINTVAAKVLGKEAPVCGEDFTTLTGVSATKYLIQVVASPYAAADSGKIAMLVAGYDAAETTLAAAKVKEGTVATTVGTKEILPITTA